MMFVNSISKTILTSKLLNLRHGQEICNFLINKSFKASFTFSTSSSVQPLSNQDSHPSSSSSYTQRAYTPSHMSSLLMQQLPKTSHSTIIHQLSLYSQKLLPFDYDYFCESLKYLLPHQAKLSLQELLMLFDLTIEYKIDNLILQNSFQSELYCRVYLGVKKELGEYDLGVKETVEKMYEQFQKGSGDHFGVIDEKFRELPQEEDKDHQDNPQGNDQVNNKESGSATQTSQQKYEINSQPIFSHNISSKPTHNSAQRKPKSKHLSQQMLLRITNIFLESNSRHIDFNKLLLQITTIRLDQQQISLEAQKDKPSLTPSFLLTYTRLTIHLLQLYMTEYQAALSAATQTKPAQYTQRSVKRIYKLQAFYYYEVAKLVEEKKLLQGSTNSELEMFVQLMASFPIRRRSFRKAIGEVLIEEVRKRKLPFDELMKFFELSRFDNRLLQHFQNMVNGIVPKLPASKPQAKQQNSQEQTIQNSQTKPLVPEIVDEPQKQTQNLFKLPAQLFRKVTKKKSKPKNRKFAKENQQEIDLTQPDEQVTNENIPNDSQTHEHKISQIMTQKQQISK